MELFLYIRVLLVIIDNNLENHNLNNEKQHLLNLKMERDQIKSPNTLFSKWSAIIIIFPHCMLWNGILWFWKTEEKRILNCP